MRHTIYGLRELGSKEVRYVGLTNGPIAKRLDGHLKAAERERHNPSLCRWLRENSAEIEIFALGYAETREEARALERVFVALCARLNHQLLNQRLLPVALVKAA